LPLVNAAVTLNSPGVEEKGKGMWASGFPYSPSPAIGATPAPESVDSSCTGGGTGVMGQPKVLISLWREEWLA